MARLQVALWALRQRRLDQLRAVHVPRHQQDPGGVVQRVRLFELVLQRPGLQGGALLHGQRQAGQQHAQQNPMQSFHACPSRVENTWMSLRRSQSDWARQNACASSAASRTKTWDLPIPPRQTRQHFVEHPPRQPQPSITGIDHQVLEVTTATVMPGHQAGDHLPFGFDQQAQPGVALKVGEEEGIGVLRTEADTWRSRPQREECRVIGGDDAAKLHRNGSGPGTAVYTEPRRWRAPGRIVAAGAPAGWKAARRQTKLSP